MTTEEIYFEMDSLQTQIDELEKNFDIALQSPHQLEQARSIYRNIKLLERRLSELQIFLRNKSN